jgi:general secretion pathway protein H
MRTLAAGSRNAGFTLLELLVVMAIIAIASAGVGFALRDNSQVQLTREADRLAAWLESARAQSRMTGLPVRWVATADGFTFDGFAVNAQGVVPPSSWLSADTVVAVGAVLSLGPDPIIGPQSVSLSLRSDPGRQLRLATDGVRPFQLQALAP